MAEQLFLSHFLNKTRPVDDACLEQAVPKEKSQSSRSSSVEPAASFAERNWEHVKVVLDISTLCAKLERTREMFSIQAIS